MKKIKILKLVTGEMLISEVEFNGVGDPIGLLYPAQFIPVPNTQSIQFGKFLPFSDYSEEITINIDAIASMSTPIDDMKNGYEEFVKHMKAQESGIVVPTTKITEGMLNMKGADR